MDLKLTPKFFSIIFVPDEKSMALKSMAAQGTSLLLTTFEKLFVTCSVPSYASISSFDAFDEAISLFKGRRRRKICFDSSLSAVCDKYTGSPPIL